MVKELEQAKLVEYEGYSGRQGDEDTSDGLRRQGNESLIDSGIGTGSGTGSGSGGMAGESGASVSQAQLETASRLLREENSVMASIAGLNIYGTPLGAPTSTGGTAAVPSLAYSTAEIRDSSAASHHHNLLKTISSSSSSSSDAADGDMQQAISMAGGEMMNPLLVPYHAAMDSSFGLGAWNADSTGSYGPVLAGRYVAKRRHDADKQVSISIITAASLAIIYALNTNHTYMWHILWYRRSSLRSQT